MTEQEIIELEIERRACLETVSELSRGDQCMNIVIFAMTKSLLQKADQIQEKLDRHFGRI